MRIASAVRATRALTGGIVAAHAAVAAKRASFNPLVQGSTPWRPTSCCFMSFGGGSVESFDVYGGTDSITRTLPSARGGPGRTWRSRGRGRRSRHQG